MSSSKHAAHTPDFQRLSSTSRWMASSRTWYVRILSRAARGRYAVARPGVIDRALSSTFDLRQLLFELAKAVFGPLVWRATLDHAPDQLLLIRDLPLQLSKSGI